jgi:hypothetical protein
MSYVERQGEHPMKNNVTLTVTTLLLVLLVTFHLAGDIVLGYEKGGLSNLAALPIFAVWLFGTLRLAGRRSGYIIMLVGSLLGLLVPWFHMSGNGLGYAAAKHGADVFFVWGTLAIGVTALLSLVLSVQGLLGLGRRSH